MRLILAKHAAPQLVPGQSAHTWTLSARGRAQACALGARLVPYRPTRLLSSAEPKARETAELMSAFLPGLHVEALEALGEHRRAGVGWIETPEAFRATVAGVFAAPERVVWGEESADAAHARFDRGLTEALKQRDDACVVAVAHGTVIALWAARAAGLSDPYALWARLGLPSFVVLELGGARASVVEVVEAVG